jgi:hypothetical protein
MAIATRPKQIMEATAVDSFSVDGGNEWSPKVTYRAPVPEVASDNCDNALAAMNQHLAENYDAFLEEAGHNTKALTGKSRLKS